MSIQEIRERLADVAGASDLTMVSIAGRDCYSLGGKMIAVDPGASNADIESAIRNAIGSNAIVQMPIAAGPQPVPSSPQPSQPKVTSMSITGAGAAGLSIKAMFEKQKAKIAADLQANLAHVQEGFDKQNAAVAAVGSLGDKVHAEADDLMASIGQFANDLTGEAQ